MLTFKHATVVAAVLALGFVACGDSGSDNKPDAPLISLGGTPGTGGAGAGGTIVGPDAPMVGVGGSVGVDAATANGGSVPIDGPGSIVDAIAGELGLAPVLCSNTKEGNRAIINAPVAAGVVEVDVQGAKPPTYDPNTSTCK